MYCRHFISVVFCAASLLYLCVDSCAEEAAPVYFEQSARSILKTHCWHCHGEEEELQGGLDLRLVRSMLAGGDSGPALVPHESSNSLVLTRIRDGEMPPSGKALGEDEIAILQGWIEAGALTEYPEPESLDDHNQWTVQERNHWSFQPIENPLPPSVAGLDLIRTPIDRFILARLEQQQLSFSAEADRTTLLRRLTFDLHGLPPTIEQQETFLKDESPGAVERLVDRLLADPAYGERWGRHWLDTAGYADSDGYNENDRERGWMYRYRDYVIRAFNSDLSFDQFVIEQLAGDELVTSPLTNLQREDIDKLTATGFLRLAPDGTGQGEEDPMLTRNEFAAETIKVVTSSLLGMTVGCAQCHNHRYDPISQTDYYRIRAIFDPGLDVQDWRNRPARLVSTWDEQQRQQATAVDAELAEIEKQRLAELDSLVNEVFEKKVAELPAEQHELARQARATAAQDRTAEQVAILKDFPSLNVDRGSVYLYEPARMQEFNKKYEAIVATAREKRPAESFIDAFTEIPGKRPPTHLFYRGDHNQPREVVTPSGLSVLAINREFPGDDPALPTSGRRLAYAQHLTNGEHPLFARVIVNRLWMHHFGRGIVATPADFGILGDLPSHPELLDWLASEFQGSGWSVKHLQRLIVLSRTYRQVATRTASLEQVDPENKLLGRMNVRRLEAEAIRDAMIHVAGAVNGTMFGPPEVVNPDDVGQIIVGKAERDGNGILVAKDLDTAASYRRSVYVQARRSMPLGMLEPFDLPSTSPNCDRRASSTVATQSLLLMNNRQSLRLAERFAERLQATASNPVEQLRLGWELAYGSTPSAQQLQQANQFLQAQLAMLKQRAGEAAANESAAKDATEQEKSVALQALALYCQALFSSNRFLYVD